MPTFATSGSLATTSAQRDLTARHLGERDVLRGFGRSDDEAGVLGREEALRNDDEQVAGKRNRQDEDARA